MQKPSKASRQVLLDTHVHLNPDPHRHYNQHSFSLPEGASQVGVNLSFHNDGEVYLFLSLHAQDEFRGSCLDPVTRGDIHLNLWVSPSDASAGAIPGELPSGKWRVQVDNRDLTVQTDYRLKIWAEFEPVPAVKPFSWPENHIVQQKPGWYCGELHCHSTESDGGASVREVVEAAENVGLDFLAITDHFTISQWRPMLDLLDHPIALIRSCELTSERGHANLHGLHEWVDVYTDRRGWDMNQAADAAHSQGALFCVNHPFVSRFGWQALEFNWQKADLMEVFHTTSYSSNSFSLSFWDRLLCSGYRVIGIGSTDSHHPTEGISILGKVVTWVYAPELSEQGILKGLQNGQVIVSQGAQMKFSAVNQHGERAQMWDSLPPDSLVTLEVKYRSDEPLVMLVIKDGFVIYELELDASPGKWSSVTCSEPELLIHSDQPLPGYFRVELHAVSRHPVTELVERDYLTTRAISNPIWVGQQPPAINNKIPGA